MASPRQAVAASASQEWLEASRPQKVAKIPTDGLGLPIPVLAKHELTQDERTLGLKIWQPL